MKKSPDAFSIGFSFLFVCGIFGMISLILECAYDLKVLFDASAIEYIAAIFIGIFTSLGIVCANISAGIGNAGISICIMNVYVIVIAAFNYLVFG